MARGPDHPALGAVATGAAGPRLGAAVSAGGRPKDPPSTEPNEDGYLVATSEGCSLLLVVDGAGGFDAASSVLQAVEAAVPDMLASTDPPGTAARAWSAALAARDLARGSAAPLLRRPHVAASLAVVAGGELWCATTGDTAVLRVRGGAVRLVSGVAPHLDHTAALPLPQRAPLVAGDVVVCLTDGFFDGLGSRWASLVGRVVADHEGTAAEIAATLVRAAVEAGVRDHVTAAVLAVEPGEGPQPPGDAAGSPTK